MTKRKTESQIVAILKEAEAGLSVQEICCIGAIVVEFTSVKCQDGINLRAIG